jgi:hypothetical protein
MKILKKSNGNEEEILAVKQLWITNKNLTRSLSQIIAIKNPQTFGCRFY